MESKTVFIVDSYKKHAVNTLTDFRSEFGEYIKKSLHKGQVTLINGIRIVAIGESEAKLRTLGMRNYAIYGAEYFMELCYKNGYHALKSRLEREELIVPVKDLGTPEVLLEAEFKRVLDAMKESGERVNKDGKEN